ncbi:NAD dependent epimerase/dehydratase family protein [Biscogniauxia mediterranea]|nr:NAD dependent epimerase/dehydratase family protein [Biscogniauxia mediterranea]
MSSSTPPQILLTGATGFIGGAVLTHLLNSSSPILSNATITCLVRGTDRVSKLRTTYGGRVRPVLYRDLDDIEVTTAVAAEHDLVINTTLGFHAASAQALLRGLAQRKASTGRDVWMVHTSGQSNLSEQTFSRTYMEKIPGREFDDAVDDVYSYEKEREALHPYLQRSTELGVIDTGLELGVKTLVIMSPTIYGLGSGPFNKISIQIPTYIRTALAHGRAIVVGSGDNVNDKVHVEDLADLYKIVALDILGNGGKKCPVGKRGIIFSGTGRFSWREVAQQVADACYEEGKISDKQVESVSLAEAARLFTSYAADKVDEGNVELGLAGNARTVATVAKTLGWEPTRGEEEWRKGFRDDLKEILKR